MGFLGHRVTVAGSGLVPVIGPFWTVLLNPHTHGKLSPATLMVLTSVWLREEQQRAPEITLKALFKKEIDVLF